MRQTTDDVPDFAALLATVTTEPGVLSAAYTAFHQYSFGNMLHAYAQCEERGIALGPLATYHRWRELGRQVRKGEKAIELCQPITCKRRTDDADEPETYTRFVLRRNWFVLAQTDGQPYEQTPPEAWDKARALAALDITDTPFDLINGNAQGRARGRTISISPVAALPWKSTFHEIAHVILGHTAEAAELADNDRTAYTIGEVEAESVAMLCCAALGLPGLAESRGYIQHWYGTGQPIPETNARKIFKAADAILKAGRPATTEAT